MKTSSFEVAWEMLYVFLCLKALTEVITISTLVGLIFMGIISYRGVFFWEKALTCLWCTSWHIKPWLIHCWSSPWILGGWAGRGMRGCHAAALCLENLPAGEAGAWGNGKVCAYPGWMPRNPVSPILGSHDLLIVTATEHSKKDALSLSRQQ